MRSAPWIDEAVGGPLHHQEWHAHRGQCFVHTVHRDEHLRAEARANRRAEHERVVVVCIHDGVVAADPVQRQPQHAHVGRNAREHAADRELDLGNITRARRGSGEHEPVERGVRAHREVERDQTAHAVAEEHETL